VVFGQIQGPQKKGQKRSEEELREKLKRGLSLSAVSVRPWEIRKRTDGEGFLDI